jgi:hypothetical protein
MGDQTCGPDLRDPYSRAFGPGGYEVGLILDGFAILDARGRCAHVRSGGPPIVRPR